MIPIKAIVLHSVVDACIENNRECSWKGDMPTIYVMVQFYPWFPFVFRYGNVCLFTYSCSLTQREKKNLNQGYSPLNHNIYNIAEIKYKSNKTNNS